MNSLSCSGLGGRFRALRLGRDVLLGHVNRDCERGGETGGKQDDKGRLQARCAKEDSPTSGIFVLTPFCPVMSCGCMILTRQPMMPWRIMMWRVA